MTSAVLERPAARSSRPRRGDQRPRIATAPPAETSAGKEAIDLARLAGLHLDPWEQFILDRSLGERPDGKWAAFEVGVEAPRQNGKGAILEARELAGLFLFGERLLTHTAHLFDTSLEAFTRLLTLIQQTPDLERRVHRVSKSHGDEGITLTGGQRIRFRARTGGGGRGFSGDFIAFDEAMDLPETALGALFPTLSARPNPQIWYMGSPVDQQIHQHGVVFARVRERGINRTDPRLAYFEFSLPYDSPADVPARVARDPKAWAQANPALGIRISKDFIAAEQRAMAARTFAVERLGVGDWPRTDIAPNVITLESWKARTDLRSRLVDPVCFAVDVTPDRSWSAIAAAGYRPDGRKHAEIVEHRRGTKWVPDRLAELVDGHDTVAEGPVQLDGAGPAASLLPDLENPERDLDVNAVSAGEHAKACGRLVDDVTNDALRHLDTPELEAAIEGAAQRPLGDAWAWSRKSSSVDISPLVAMTLALWGLSQSPPRKPKAGIEYW